MKVFIDSADLDEIKQAYEWGIADGVTTNPSLMKKAVDKRKKINLKQYIDQILKIAKGTPVSSRHDYPRKETLQIIQSCC